MTALLIISGAALAKEKSLPALTTADDRTQQLYDQAVKLHRRYAGDPKHPMEPYKSILTELSLYHDDEQATYLSDLGVDGKRSGPVQIAPWAQEQLALLDMQQKSFADALQDFLDLGERFPGRMVTEPADGEMASNELADLTSLNGVIAATLEVAKQTPSKGVLDALHTRIELLQQKFGAQMLPCGDACGDYGHKALEYLWKALELDQASYNDWSKATLAFVKRETSRDFKAAILIALAEGDERLGKLAQEKEIFERVAVEYPETMATSPSKVAFSEFGIYAARRRLALAQAENKDVAKYEALLNSVHQAVIEVLKRSRSPQMPDDQFEAGLKVVQDEIDKPLEKEIYGIPQGIFENLIHS